MPVDPEVVVGTLPNGLRYYVRPNPRPARRVELRLVVRAGSVLEDADQQGLAHFVEHMLFEGTTNFPGSGHQRLPGVARPRYRRGRECADELRRHAVHAARADRFARGARSRAARLEGLGPGRHVRSECDRAPARHRPVGVAAAPRRRGANTRQDPPRSARRIAVRQPHADRRSRRDSARAARAVDALLSRLVPPGSDGGDYRRRGRSRCRREDDHVALLVVDQSVAGAATAGLRCARASRHPLQRHHRQGNDCDVGRHHQPAAGTSAGYGRWLSRHHDGRSVR